VEQLVLAVEPLVDFLCNFPVEGRLPSDMGVPVDGCVMLRPDFEEESPYRGGHSSKPSSAGASWVLTASFTEVLVLQECPFARPPLVEDLLPAKLSLFMKQRMETFIDKCWINLRLAEPIAPTVKQ
jgi:hypothetical protein